MSGETPMIEYEVPDHIHHYITLSQEDFDRLQNNFAQGEIQRLTKISHLGVASKICRLARHDKFEHAYGAYWLCRQCIDYTHGVVTKKKAFPLAGILHGIGHLPFSYYTEYAIAKLYQTHQPSRIWLNGIFDECVNFAQHPGVENAAKEMKRQINYLMLHRWFTSLKIARSNTNEFRNHIGKNIVSILVDTQTLEHRLLQELDKIDYVLRDMHYLAFGRMELNITPLLAQFSKSPEGRLKCPDIMKLINVTHDWLCDQVYLGPKERCLAQVIEKALFREVADGHLNIDELLSMTDDEFEERLSQFHSCRISLESITGKIEKGRMIEVARVVCDCEGSNIETEKYIAQTNITGLHKYSQIKGIYIQCTPNPYKTDWPAFDGTESGASVSIAYDLDSGHAGNLIRALVRTEDWAPNNIYGVNMSCRREALEFILGKQVEPHFERFDDMEEIIRSCIPEERWNSKLFSKSWELREEAVEHLLYEYDFDWPPIKHFIQYPEHWSTRIINKVRRAVKDQYERARRRRNELESSYQERKDRMLEYSTYLDAVLYIQKKDIAGWVLPSVWILDKNGEPENEVDVITLYIPIPQGHPVKVELLEVSSNDSDENLTKNRRKLKKVAQDIKNRFGRQVQVKGYFNDHQVVP